MLENHFTVDSVVGGGTGTVIAISLAGIPFGHCWISA